MAMRSGGTVGKLKSFMLKVVGWRGDDGRNLVKPIAEPVQRRIRAMVQREHERERETNWHQLQQRSASKIPPDGTFINHKS